MMNRFLLICFAILCFSSTNDLRAQENGNGENNRVAVSAGLLTEGTTSFRLDYQRMFSKYFGLGAGIFLNSSFSQSTLPHGTYLSEGEAFSWSSETKVTKPGLALSAIGRIPIASIRDTGLSLEIEPSWLLSSPKEVHTVHIQSSRTQMSDWERINVTGGQWNAWLIRAGLTADINEYLGIGISYSISNFDSYSTARLLEYRGGSFARNYPERKDVVHQVSISAIIAFY